jgi:hypothetical protein
MVQVIENRADIEGRVVAIAADKVRPGHSLVTIEVGTASGVEGYSNLFTSAYGKHLDVVLPSDQASALQVGATVRCRVRRADPSTVIGERCIPL